MFDVTKEVSVFVVHSTSLFPTTDKNDFQEQMPSVVGKSYEAGVKVELLNGKISGTISAYQINQTGGAQRDPSAINRKKQLWDSYTVAQRAANFPGITNRDELTSDSGSPGDLVPGAEQESKGIEADLVFQPVKQVQVLFSYAHNDAKVKSAINKATIGQRTSGHIKDQLAILGKYQFIDGSLKGLSFGLGMQMAGKALQDYSGPNASARYSPSTFYAETFAGYNFKAFGYNQRVQLNLKNLTTQEEYVGWKATGSASKIATERYEVPTKMIISLTYGLDF
jgi:outer membrane receptor for ferric coprogen and ferric-rhodotorulic acid